MQISSLLNLSSGLLLILLYFPFTAADNFVYIYSNTSLAGGAHTAKPGCPSKCGDLTVPYPFGIGSNATCSINPFFDINCNTSFDPPKAFLGSPEYASTGFTQVLGISETKIRIKTSPSWQCYDRHGNNTQMEVFWMDMSDSPFSFSDENKLTVVGCDDIAFLVEGYHAGDDFNSSSMAVCSKPGDLKNGFCSGIGCCQASIPIGLQSFYVDMSTMNEHKKVHHFSSCGYSFLGEQNSYTFNISDISDSVSFSRKLETVPLVLDWAIGSQTCEQVRNTSGIICQGNSICADSGSILGGYRCNCSQGYQGNPYLSPGCCSSLSGPSRIS